MGWKDLLQTANETLVSPWVGGRSLRQGTRTWAIQGDLPREFGWYSFTLHHREARFSSSVGVSPEALHHVQTGYLVGDRLVPEGVRVDPDPKGIAACSERVFLIEPGLDRFVRISAGRMFEGGPLIFRQQEMPLGPESMVLGAYLDKSPSIDDIPGVAPALDAAFRMELWRKVEAERRRAELERKRREEEEKRQKEERRRQLVEKLGDASGRREMARVDFEEAARAALAVGGAELLDVRPSYQRGEHIVRYRFERRRFECVCDRDLRIVDAGVCLTNEETGEKGDTFFTLESLPSVLREADREGRLVIFRHVD
jgi:hypothetical protein